MGTLVEISVSGIDQESAYSSIQQAFQEIRRLENLMSTHLPTSEVSRINQAAGKNFVPVSQEVLEIIQRSLFWSEQTEGAFDITIGPAQELWDFDEPGLPSNTTIADTAKLIDYRNIQIKKNTVFLPKKGMRLHLGAIGKGYAVDRAIEILKNNKIKNALINAGGDLITLGKRSDSLSWKIGLQHPRNPESLLASFSTSKKAIATSGDYQKYFELGGKRYHHILDPKTGRPSNGAMSTTVIADNVMDADALATAIFVLGPEKGIALLDSLDNMEGLIVDIHGTVSLSKNINSIENFTLSSNNIRH
ncbi:MAG: FAD:protein FMN transferase [Nitrospina sp.]|nr:FAD:protein FMN transferase [Nitrospina sp.]MBT6718223.1 FAD:protein FMN transferase [Nitrospina sp.]